jgi:hypothetical protein
MVERGVERILSRDADESLGIHLDRTEVVGEERSDQNMIRSIALPPRNSGKNKALLYLTPAAKKT